MMRSPLVLVALAALTPSSALAYELKQTSTGAPVRWDLGEVTVVVSLEDGPRGVPDGAAEVLAALATWQDELIGSGVALGAIITDEPVETRSDDGKNTIRWSFDKDDPALAPGVLAMAHLRYRAADGAIEDADIVINAAEHAWTVAGDGCYGAYDLQSTVAHELGHLLGLAHSHEGDATMFSRGGACDVSRRDLSQDDRAGIVLLYDELPPPSRGELGLSGCAAGGGAAGGGARFGLLVGLALLYARRRRVA
jgi:hypothetical protein